MQKPDFFMREPEEDFYNHFLRLGDTESLIPISDKMDYAFKIVADRDLSLENISSTACKELVALVVLGLVSEGWKIFQPISDPHNSAMSINYQYIQNTFLDQKE